MSLSEILTSSQGFAFTCRDLVDFLFVVDIAAFYTLELKVSGHPRQNKYFHQLTYQKKKIYIILKLKSLQMWPTKQGQRDVFKILDFPNYPGLHL